MLESIASGTVRMVFDALKCAQWQATSKLFVPTSAAHEIDRRRGSEAMTPATQRTEKPKMTKETGDNDDR